MRTTLLALAALAALSGCATVAVTGTPLEKAIAKGDAKEVEQLLVEGADPNRKDLLTRISPSCRAVRAHNIEILKILIKHGANIVKESDALYCAVDTGQLDTVKFLVEQGAPIGTLALLRAQEHQPEILAYLKDVESQRKSAQAAAKAQPPAPPAPVPAIPVAPPPAPSTATAQSPAISSAPFAVAQRPLDVAAIVATGPDADARAELAASRLAALGYPPERTIKAVGPGASRAGLAKTVEGRLPQIYKDGGTVFFYFTGGGASAKGLSYLMPFDGDPAFPEQTAYPVSRLLDQLASLHSRLVVVVLDAPIALSGASAAGVYAISASTASRGDFSKLFFEGLDGAAKDSRDVVTLGSIGDYVEKKSAPPSALPSRQRLAEVVLH